MAQNTNTLDNGVSGVARSLLSSMHLATLIPMSTMIAPYSDPQKSGKGTLPGLDSFQKSNREASPGDALKFISKAMLYNATASSAQTLYGTGMEAMLAEVLFIMGKIWYYKFLINPNNFRMTTAKLQSVEETSDLTIINTYRNASPTMSLSGVSGCTMNKFLMELTNEQDSFPMDLSGALVRYPKLSTAYLKFRQLEKFYNDTNSDVVIIYDMDLYVGKLSSFNFNMDANNPWVINYDLTLKLYPGLTLHTYSVYDYTPFFNELMNRYGTTFAKDFEGKSKTTPAGM